MLTKSRLATAAALVLGGISVAQAANDNQSDPLRGADFGPLGQCFAPPDCDYRGVYYPPQGYPPRRAASGFASVPEQRYRHRHEHRAR
jgi:hypothetical protein